MCKQNAAGGTGSASSIPIVRPPEAAALRRLKDSNASAKGVTVIEEHQRTFNELKSRIDDLRSYL